MVVVHGPQPSHGTGPQRLCQGVTHQVPIALEPALANGAYNVSVILVSPRRQVLVRTQPVSFVVQSSPHGEAPPQPMQWLSTVRDFDFGMGSPNGEQGVRANSRSPNTPLAACTLTFSACPCCSCWRCCSSTWEQPKDLAPTEAPPWRCSRLS